MGARSPRPIASNVNAPLLVLAARDPYRPRRLPTRSERLFSNDTITNEIGAHEILLVLAVALLAKGASMVYPDLGYIVVGITLLYLTLPTRAPWFIDDDDRRRRRQRPVNGSPSR
jgi:hypothetical protein